MNTLWVILVSLFAATAVAVELKQHTKANQLNQQYLFSLQPLERIQTMEDKITIITGTGRAGTSFLMALLTYIGTTHHLAVIQLQYGSE